MTSGTKKKATIPPKGLQLRDSFTALVAETGIAVEWSISDSWIWTTQGHQEEAASGKTGKENFQLGTWKSAQLIVTLTLIVCACALIYVAQGANGRN